MGKKRGGAHREHPPSRDAFFNQKTASKKLSESLSKRLWQVNLPEWTHGKGIVANPVERRRLLECYMFKAGATREGPLVDRTDCRRENEGFKTSTVFKGVAFNRESFCTSSFEDNALET